MSDSSISGWSRKCRAEPRLRSATSTLPGLNAWHLPIITEATSEALRVATIGDIGPNLAKFNAGDRLVPIRVQLDEAARTDIRNIAALRVTNANGVSIPLTAVAEIGFGEGPSSIDRYDRERRATIGADLKRGFELGTAQDRFHEIVKQVGLPRPAGEMDARGADEIIGPAAQDDRGSGPSDRIGLLQCPPGRADRSVPSNVVASRRDARNELLCKRSEQRTDQDALIDFGKGRRSEHLCLRHLLPPRTVSFIAPCDALTIERSTTYR